MRKLRISIKYSHGIEWVLKNYLLNEESRETLRVSR